MRPTNRGGVTYIITVLCVIAFVFVFNQDNLYAQGQGGPPIWRLDGNLISEGDFLGTTNDMPLVFKINATEAMRLLPDGNVGIGITNPQARLDVNGNAIFRGGVYIENKLKVGSIMLYAEGNNMFVPGERGYLYIQSRNDSKHTIINNNNPGYVGIGTDTPGKKLHVKETRQSGYDPHPRLPKSKVNIDSTLMDQDIRERDSLITNTEKRGSIRLELTVPQEDNHTTWDIQPTVSNYNNKMPGSLQFIDAENKHTVMAMQDNGAVGIGTISPMSRLHVHGGNLTLTKGRMGIGVQRPQAALDVVGEVKVKYGSIEMRNENSRSILNTDLQVVPEPESPVSYFNIDHCGISPYGGGLRFLTGVCPTPEERMRITPEGKVGIGTTNPKFQMHIKSRYPESIDNITASGSNAETDWNKQGILKLENSNNALVMFTSGGWNERKSFIQSGHNNGNFSDALGVLALNPFGGNVGIGTSSPDYKLDVCGKIRSKEWIVEEFSCMPDFVFQPEYELMPLGKRKQMIFENSHMPYMLPESEMVESGVPVFKTMQGLMQNTEEIYLYLFEMDERLKELEKENQELKENNKELMQEIKAMKNI